MLNVVYCRRVVTTGDCHTALPGPAPSRPGVWSCYLEAEGLFPPVRIFFNLFPCAGYFFNASD